MADVPDALNRLATAGAINNSWGQSYTFDGFGNLTDQNVTAGSGSPLRVVYNASNNRQTGDCADANGNLIGSALPGSSGQRTHYLWIRMPMRPSIYLTNRALNARTRRALARAAVNQSRSPPTRV